MNKVSEILTTMEWLFLTTILVSFFCSQYTSATHMRNATHKVSTIMKSLDLVCETIAYHDCFECLDANNNVSHGNYTWCTKPNFCFLMDGSENANDCTIECSGEWYGSGEVGKCDDSTYAVGALIVSFILLVLCPLCLTCGCCYVIVVRCRNMVDNKIAADNSIATFSAGGGSVPIPLLQVYQGEDDAMHCMPASTGASTSSSRNYNTVRQLDVSGFVLAEARVAAEGDGVDDVDAEAAVAAVLLPVSSAAVPVPSAMPRAHNA